MEVPIGAKVAKELLNLINRDIWELFWKRYCKHKYEYTRDEFVDIIASHTGYHELGWERRAKSSTGPIQSDWNFIDWKFEPIGNHDRRPRPTLRVTNQSLEDEQTCINGNDGDNRNCRSIGDRIDNDNQQCEEIGTRGDTEGSDTCERCGERSFWPDEVDKRFILRKSRYLYAVSRYGDEQGIWKRYFDVDFHSRRINFLPWNRNIYDRWAGNWHEVVCPGRDNSSNDRND